MSLRKVPIRSLPRRVDIEQVVLLKFADKLSIFWPVEILAALLVDIEISFGDSILIHCDQLAILVLILGTDANITITASHV